MAKDFEVTSMVSNRTLEPAVQIHPPSGHTQMAPEEARMIAYQPLEAAEAAEQDAATVAFLMEHDQFTLADAGRFLMALREQREKRMRERREGGGG